MADPKPDDRQLIALMAALIHANASDVHSPADAVSVAQTILAETDKALQPQPEPQPEQTAPALEASAIPPAQQPAEAAAPAPREVRRRLR